MSTPPLHLTLAGREQVVEAGTTAGEALTIAAGPEPARDPSSVLAARVNGELRDLSYRVSDGDVIEEVPFMLIAGDDDVAKDAVSFRYRDGSRKNGVPIEAAVDEVVTAVRERVQV